MAFDRGDNSALVGSSVAPVVNPGARGNVLTSNGTLWESKPVLTRETEKSLTGLSSVTFSNIPSNVKKIEVLMHEVSSDSINPFLIQLGTDAGIETTNYTSASNLSSLTASSISTNGFRIQGGSATMVDAGILTLINMYGNVWISTSIVEGADTSVSRLITSAGQKTLAGVLTQIKFTTTSTDVFDSGKINIIYSF